MKKFITLLALSLFTTVGIAQTNATPPEQAPAGNPGKLVTKKKPAVVAPDADPATAATPTDKRAARKDKRAAKVGDKPIN